MGFGRKKHYSFLDIIRGIKHAVNAAQDSTGYVSLSNATVLAQHNRVTAVDVISEKVEKNNKRISTIQDEYIEKELAEKELGLTATLNDAATTITPTLRTSCIAASGATTSPVPKSIPSSAKPSPSTSPNSQWRNLCNPEDTIQHGNSRRSLQ